MKFIDRILLQINGKDRYRLLSSWIAECQSEHPATAHMLDSWLPHLTNSDQALASLFLASFLPYWNSDRLFKRLGELCYLHRYEGEWQLVQELLEKDVLARKDANLETGEDWLSFQSEDDFFGNFLVGAERLLRLNKHSWKKPEEPHQAKRRTRRRGYSDKGTLRPPHQRGRNLPDPDPGQDRRDLIRHPLLECTGESSGNQTLSLVLHMKGGSSHDLLLLSGGP